MIADEGPAPERLQFDRVEPVAADAGASPEPPGVTCVGCGAIIPTEYFAVNGSPACRTCKLEVERLAAVPQRWPRFLGAAALGLGAAIAGAILYYAVIAITNFEIGFVAIAIGYMVGFAVNKGAGGRGGRRYQLLAVFLTYLSVGLAYVPVAIKATAKTSESATASDPETPADAGRPKLAPAAAPSSVSLSRVAVTVLLFSLTLPVLVVFGSLPSGLLSGLIVGIGMRQAWRMTSAPVLVVAGPYQIGPAALSSL